MKASTWLILALGLALWWQALTLPWPQRLFLAAAYLLVYALGAYRGWDAATELCDDLRQDAAEHGEGS